MTSIGELWPILIVVLLLFGAQRLPSLAKSMGEGIREFKKSVRDVTEDDEPKSAAGKPQI